MQFTLEATDAYSSARAGTLATGHGPIRTPIFMPVGTAGSVKTITQQDLTDRVKAQIILGNTYHLYLRPGMDVMERAGGLHQFMAWNGPILTDSGGYQVFSLAENRKIKEEGALFQSHIDGSRHLFSPEKVMDIQRSLGSDIVMAFDECPPYPSTYAYARKSMEMTHRWLARCQTRFAATDPYYGHPQALFPIVQGSTYKDLRIASAEFVASTNAYGNAIGGLSVGEPTESMYETTELVCGILPKNRPRYLMGVGTPANILENIALGVDMFDCVMPTRNARTGYLFYDHGILNIKNEKWRTDFSPIDDTSDLDTDHRYSKAYLAHLIRSGEMLGATLATLHNLRFYLSLVERARAHIIAGTFTAWKNSMVGPLSTRI